MHNVMAFRCASMVQNASAKEQEAAMRRYLAICEIEARCAVFGQSRSAAVSAIAAKNRVTPGAVWRWLRWAKGIEACPAVRLRWLLGSRSRKMHPEHLRLLEEALHVGA